MAKPKKSSAKASGFGALPRERKVPLNKNLTYDEVIARIRKSPYSDVEKFLDIDKEHPVTDKGLQATLKMGVFSKCGALGKLISNKVADEREKKEKYVNREGIVSEIHTFEHDTLNLLISLVQGLLRDPVPETKSQAKGGVYLFGVSRKWSEDEFRKHYELAKMQAEVGQKLDFYYID